MKIFPNLNSVAESFKGILLDAYGVFWGGNDHGILSGSKEAMEELFLKGKIIGILSNSTQLAAKEIDKLHRHGLMQGKHYHFFITSGEITRYLFLNEKLPFQTPRKTYWLFGGIHPKFSSHEAIFQNSGFCQTEDIHQADFIYISIPHINGEDQTDPEVFRQDIEKIRSRNLPMVCANPDRFAHEGKPPRAVVRQGAIASSYEEMGGQVFYIGKPNNKAYTHALDQFRKYNVNNPAEILMVGDTPETDIRGARLVGMPSALVTQTGIMADRLSHKGINALKNLPIEDIPDYFVERFAYGIHSSP